MKVLSYSLVRQEHKHGSRHESDTSASACTRGPTCQGIRPTNLFNKEQHAGLWVISLSYYKHVVASSVAPLTTTNPIPWSGGLPPERAIDLGFVRIKGATEDATTCL
ncbi:hypothetical protein HaLaN_02705 [Haematococcus lacustris]|uniref:Uncharacterized protein n=1 Tax=Haematococcus lacustris TaxID=44745 RepID=A0A699YLY9_HAELA|nr:hypothetical protein HaLaN_02705 [Haematococcus lacustris]